jgi:hypothetical protein
MKNKYMRHGDVFIIEIKIPQDAKETDGHILEYGEVTNHCHQLRASEVSDGAARIYQTKNGQKYLRVWRPVDVSHEEHETRTIPPGDYEIRRTKETDHMKGVTRLLAD